MEPTKADIEQERIKAGLCPKCGSSMKDKESYVRCTKCDFSITCGAWDEDEGYCVSCEVD